MLNFLLPEADGIDPETLEGIDVILERARQRLARRSSNTENYSEVSLNPKKDQDPINSHPTSPLITAGRSSLYRSNRSGGRSRKIPRVLESCNEGSDQGSSDHRNPPILSRFPSRTSQESVTPRILPTQEEEELQEPSNTPLNDIHESKVWQTRLILKRQVFCVPFVHLVKHSSRFWIHSTYLIKFY